MPFSMQQIVRVLHNAYDPGEMIMFLKIGLLCCHPNPDGRPRMRDIINIWKGLSPFPLLPSSRLVPVFPFSANGLALGCNWDDTTIVFTGAEEGEAEQSGTRTSALDSDGQTGLKIHSQYDADSPPLQRTEEGNDGSENNTLVPFWVSSGDGFSIFQFRVM
ncbi:unnamed protein product [Calypogeia fissa]